MVAGWLVSPIIKEMVSKVRFYLESQHNWSTPMKNDLRSLEAKMVEILDALSDVERRQIADSNLTAELLLGWMKETVYEAENMMDEFDYLFLNAKELRRSKATRFTSSFGVRRRLFGQDIFGQNIFPQKLSKVCKTLEEVNSIANLFLDVAALEKHIQQTKRMEWRRLTSPVSPELVAFIGRNKEREEIIQALLQPGNIETESGSTNAGPFILPIVGGGGAGKTALAQDVYNDKNVTANFEMMRWVCVSDNFDMFRISKEILEASNSKADVDLSLNMLQDMLQETWADKKYLLVLDDVWNDPKANDSENYERWMNLLGPLRCSKSGSAILVTTRFPSMAEMLLDFDHCRRGMKPCYLQGLESSESWLLFKTHAFPSESIDSPLMEELKHIGMKIVEKLKGSPLALTVAGKQLNGHYDVQKWEQMLKNALSDDIMKVLKLSFEHLPQPLQHCFAYCSLFPRDWLFEPEQLVHMWIAQGFIYSQDGSNATKEMIGRDYFKVLCNQSFFQTIEHDGKTYYIMHDMMNDLALFVSRGEYCRIESDDHGSIPSTVRHLSITIGQANRLDSMVEMKNLRSLIVLNPSGLPYCSEVDPKDDMFKNLKRVRVLVLIGYCMKQQPKVDSLIHLRYLALPVACESSLDAICSLYHLQVLVIHSHSCVCEQSVIFPHKVNKLINMQHVYFNGTMGEFHIQKKNRNKVGVLKDMDGLHGNVIIKSLENIERIDEASEARLSSKKHINKLFLEWSSSNHRSCEQDVEVLNVLQPHQNLSVLTITGYGGSRSPSWWYTNYSWKLQELYLLNCKGWKEIPPLGNLPLLKILHLRSMHALTHVGSKFYGNGQVKCFPTLEDLRFVDMPEWVEWIGLKGTQLFPSLHTLLIDKCPKLMKVPAFPLPRVKRAIISYHPKVNKEGLHLDSITSFTLMPPVNLKAIEKLIIKNCNEPMPGKGFRKLISLKDLKISKCHQLLSSMNQGYKGDNVVDIFPTSLQSLHIHHCKISSDILSRCFQNLIYLSTMKICYLDSGLSSSVDLQHLTGQVKLDIFSSRNLTALNGVNTLTSLEELLLDNMLEWVNWSGLGGAQLFPSLQRLTIAGGPNLTERISLPQIKKIIISSNFPVSQSLQLHFEGDQCSTKLKATSITYLTVMHPDNLKAIKELKIIECNEAMPLKGLREFIFLKELKISSCNQLLSSMNHKDEDKNVGNLFPQSLESLHIHHCKIMSNILSKCLQNLINLSYMEIHNIDSGSPWTLDLQHLTGLVKLNICSCRNLTTLIGADGLTSLEELWLDDMPEWIEWSGIRGTQLLSSIRRFKIARCPKLMQIPTFSPLIIKRIRIHSEPTVAQPLQLCFEGDEYSTELKANTITYLSIMHPDNLKAVEQLIIRDCNEPMLGKAFRKLISLKDLKISRCDQLLSSMNQGDDDENEANIFPMSLQSLHIDHCKITSDVLSRCFENLIALSTMKICYLDSELPCVLDLQHLIGLVKLDICSCRNITALKGGNALTSLEELLLDDMPEWIDWSGLRGTQLFPSLRKLTIAGSPNQMDRSTFSLPPVKKMRIYSDFNVAQSLQLHFEGDICSTILKATSITYLTVIHPDNLKAIEELEIIDCNEAMPSKGFRELISLKELKISSCEKLLSSMNQEDEDKNVDNLFPQSLESLHIHHCKIMSNILSKCLQNLINLSKMEIHNIDSGSPWALDLQPLKGLMKLDISSCRNLTSLIGADDLTSLEELWLDDMPEWIQYSGLRGAHLFPSIRRLKIARCPKLMIKQAISLPQFKRMSIYSESLDAQSLQLYFEGDKYSTKLKVNSITCITIMNPYNLQAIEELIIKDCNEPMPSKGFRDLISLKELIISKCDQLLSSMNHGVEYENVTDLFPQSLQSLHINHCKIMPDILSRCFQNLFAISTLKISYLYSELPWTLDLEHLTGLVKLDICSCRNLTTLKGADTLMSLEELLLDDMPNCMNWSGLRGTQLFPSLRRFTIVGDPNLMERPTFSLPQVKKMSIYSDSTVTNSLQLYFDGDKCSTKLKATTIKYLIVMHPNNLKAIGELEIIECNEAMPVKGFSELIFLKELKISSCDQLLSSMNQEEEYKNVGNLFPQSLESLHIHHCKITPDILPKCFRNLCNLSNMEIHNIDSGSPWALDLQHLTGLVKLNIYSCRNLTILIGADCLTSLEELWLVDLPDWIEWNGLRGAQLFPSIRRFTIARCPKLMKTPAFSHSVVKRISIYSKYAVSQPLQLYFEGDEYSSELKVNTITYLSIMHPDNLKAIEQLEIIECNKPMPAKGFKELISLKELKISSCDQLLSSVNCGDKDDNVHYLFPQSLQFLRINSCKIMSDILSRCLQNLIALSTMKICYLDSGLPWALDLHHMTRLVKLDISSCRNLTTLTMANSLTSLEELLLDDMPECVDWSGLRDNQLFPSLQRLKIVSCPKLMKKPAFALPLVKRLHIYSESTVAQNVQLYFEGDKYSAELKANSITYLTIMHPDNLKSVEELEIIECNEPMPMKGFRELISLKKLKISTCNQLLSSMNQGEEDEDVSDLFPQSLESLRIHRCNITSDILSRCFRNLFALSYLEIQYLDSELPWALDLQHMIRLKKLDVCSLRNMTTLRVANSLTSMEELLLDNIPEWTDWSGLGGTQLFPSLQRLKIVSCPKLMKKPAFAFPLVKRFHIYSESTVAESVQLYFEGDKYSSELKATSITYLTIMHPDNLKFVEELEIIGCNEPMPAKGFRELVSLKELKISDCNQLLSSMNHGEEDENVTNLFPQSLKSLHIHRCKITSDILSRCFQNLIALTTLEIRSLDSELSWELDLQHLTGLKKLDICSCKNLTALTGVDTLTSLQQLVIWILPQSLI